MVCFVVYCLNTILYTLFSDGSVMRNLLLSAFVGVLASIIFTTVHVKMYQKSIGVVQLDKIIAEHMQQYAGREVSDDKREFASEQFARALDSAVKEVSDKYNVVLMVSPAVVSAEADYTNEVRDVVNGYVRD